MIDYRQFIEENLFIVNKSLKTVPFILNTPQNTLLEALTGRDVILKARQEGFSSLISAMFTADFILQENSYSIIVADIDDNSEMLLEKVKKYIESYEEINKIKVHLKYNSRQELYNPFMNSRYHIGTAKNTQFGRSRTISNLHFSEGGYFDYIEKLIAGAGQAVISLSEGGKFFIETTANGFNDFKKFWESAKRGENGFKPHFFKASDFYKPEFLKDKLRELGRTFCQEYPETDLEAFIASGTCYFNTDVLKIYYNRCYEAGKGVFNKVA